MKITDIRIYKVAKNDYLKANVSITFDDMLVVWCKLCSGRNGDYITFPSHSYENRKGELEWKDDVFPLTKEFREDITDAVIDSYEKESDKEDKKDSKKSRRSFK